MISAETSTRISRAIEWLRFPLAVLVVMQHVSPMVSQLADSYSDSNLCTQIFVRFFTETFAGVAVPVFYVISGYLFFANIGLNYSKEQFYIQNKKRVKSLLLPYIYWNIIALILIKIVPFLFDYLFLNDVPSFPYKSLRHLFFSAFGVGASLPVDGPLYFIRNLILMCLLTPIIHFAIKHLSSVIVWMIIIAWVVLPPIMIEPWGSLSKAISFFMLGSYIGIAKPNLDLLWERGWIFCAAFFCLCVADTIVYTLQLRTYGGGQIVVK